MRKARPVGNRGRFRFSIGEGAFPASYKQGVDVKSRAVKIFLDSLQEVLGGQCMPRDNRVEGGEAGDGAGRGFGGLLRRPRLMSFLAMTGRRQA